MDPLVQRALQITIEQLVPLGHANRRLREQVKENLHDLDRLSGAEWALHMDELRRKYNSDVMRAAAGVLDERQMARYRQLSLQAEGLEVFSDPDVAKRLNLTQAQRERLRTLKEETDRRLEELARNAGRNRAEAERDAAELRRDRMEQAKRALTAEQRRVFSEMTGSTPDLGAGPAQPAGSKSGRPR
jgi:hypothetical protein